MVLKDFLSAELSIYVLGVIVSYGVMLLRQQVLLVVAVAEYLGVFDLEPRHECLLRCDSKEEVIILVEPLYSTLQLVLHICKPEELEITQTYMREGNRFCVSAYFSVLVCKQDCVLVDSLNYSKFFSDIYVQDLAV